MYNKGKENTPFDLYGPYVRKDKKDKWHSSKFCSYYPNISDVEVKYFSTYPDKNELCPECVELEKKNLVFK